MITLVPEAILLVPAALSVAFLLWALRALWRDEKRSVPQIRVGRYRL